MKYSILRKQEYSCQNNGMNTTVKVSPNKFYDQSFLMPPNFSVFAHQHRNDLKNNRNCSSSIGTSSDKLSVATSSNLTATTHLNQTNSNSNIGRNSAGMEKQACYLPECNSGTDCDVSRNSKVMVQSINPVEEDTDTDNGKIFEFISRKIGIKIV